MAPSGSSMTADHDGRAQPFGAHEGEQRAAQQPAGRRSLVGIVPVVDAEATERMDHGRELTTASGQGIDGARRRRRELDLLDHPPLDEPAQPLTQQVGRQPGQTLA